MLKRRILIFILCAAALTGVLMFSALADNDVAVDKVEFSFNAPGNGWSGAACPDLIYSDDAQFDLEYSNGWDYFIDDGIDYDYFPMGYNDVFVTGETYYVQMSIVPGKVTSLPKIRRSLCTAIPDAKPGSRITA